jgi:hypothetical protein
MKFVTTAVLTVYFGFCAAASHAQEFSADVVYSLPKSEASKPGQDVASPPQPSKLFVGKNQMRLENHGVSGTVLLVDWDTQTTTLLFPQHKAYQYLPKHPSQYFRVRDAEMPVLTGKWLPPSRSRARRSDLRTSPVVRR